MAQHRKDFFREEVLKRSLPDAGILTGLILEFFESSLCYGMESRRLFRESFESIIVRCSN